MHIFLTNDDGYYSSGIRALLKAAADRGHHVTLVAPLTEQSAKSHSFAISKPLFMKEYPSQTENAQIFSIDGSPADCTRIGLQMLCQSSVDVVISGINRGWNLGIAVYYSGTFSAAREGAFHHIPSIAVSAHEHSSAEILSAVAEKTILIAERYASQPEKHNAVLNLNFPNAMPFEWKETVFAPLSEAFFADTYLSFDSPRNGRCFFMEAGCETEPLEPESDWNLIQLGHPVYTLVGGYKMLDSSDMGLL